MSRRSILLVDDSTTVLTFEKLMLKDQGFELRTANNGGQAITAVQELRPDLILMDINMPEVDGIECCRRLKGDTTTSAIPIIMVTTKGQANMVSEAYAAGCDDFITKPIDKLELLAKIKTHLPTLG